MKAGEVLSIQLILHSVNIEVWWETYSDKLVLMAQKTIHTLTRCVTGGGGGRWVRSIKSDSTYPKESASKEDSESPTPSSCIFFHQSCNAGKWQCDYIGALRSRRENKMRSSNKEHCAHLYVLLFHRQNVIGAVEAKTQIWIAVVFRICKTKIMSDFRGWRLFRFISRVPIEFNDIHQQVSSMETFP